VWNEYLGERKEFLPLEKYTRKQESNVLHKTGKELDK
jgi:hypothetical protein